MTQAFPTSMKAFAIREGNGPAAKAAAARSCMDQSHVGKVVLMVGGQE